MRRPFALAVALLSMTIVVGGATPMQRMHLVIDGTSSANLAARRDVAWREGATCDLTTVRAVAARHLDVRQLVVMSTAGFASTSGSVFVAVRRADGAWRCQTSAVPARFGRAGTRPLLLRRSGDGTTPAGIFPLGTTTAWDAQRFSVFGNRPDPGVRPGVGYRTVRPQDCWGATPHTASYNKLVSRYGCQGPDEWLPRFGDVYAHAVVIGANLDPISGDAPGETPFASAIFLHRHDYEGIGTSSGPTQPTSGCVSLGQDDLVEVVRLLDPRLDPHFAIGPASWLRSPG